MIMVIVSCFRLFAICEVFWNVLFWQIFVWLQMWPIVFFWNKDTINPLTYGGCKVFLYVQYMWQLKSQNIQHSNA